ncbi:MAG TPA: hypothetical protein VGM23_15800 [Armatimonadota bacterium]|jgi:hypothetical protein
MQIGSANLALASQHTLTERREEQVSYHFWVGNARADQVRTPQRATAPSADTFSLSAEARRLQMAARQLQQAPVSNNTGATSAAKGTDEDRLSKLPPKLRIIIMMLERLTGQKITVADTGDMQQCTQQAAPQQATPARQGWGMVYEAQITHFEQEQTSFAASGTVKTTDGREIAFHINLDMSRVSMTDERLSIRAGDAALTDPLVLNFHGAAVDLTGSPTSFDLNADGKQEQMAFVGADSGLLALDRNGDGKINDGTELFGVNTGNGFAELSAYDSDQNGWIDGADPIFNNLQVWTKGTDGADQLSSLATVGVGAICLGNARTEFSLLDNSQALQGQVRSTGVFLNEDGSVGTLQQVDLATQPIEQPPAENTTPPSAE